jgi:hypothetical protein
MKESVCKKMVRVGGEGEREERKGRERKWRKDRGERR